MAKKMNFYYLSHEVDRKGVRQITDQLDEAVTVELNGQEVPIAAGFYVSSYSVRQYKRQLKLWSHLLDLMEKEQDLEEQIEQQMVGHGAQEEMSLLRARMQGVREALAMLGYGNVGPDALKLIEAQADIRYDQEL
ncbi:hypothetical protein BI084_gp46 [Gordonia phage Terapin]|uniref:Uncharacterized protein n=5 Tax=Terapinvirus terapin TaxID=2734283 RepID=A0A345MB85_9CAUD|nr:hypothetical protein BI084_gp46 [Gordonia phage Terapin]AVP43322.1 hypothetical protein PBI_DJOKOVIC_45 [Gordonia phage Djokovic]AXH67756.1 hypothetical protein SEA_BEYONCAGE_45 [Gordonia phage Beyoncage]QOC56190.1 hypothetical protein SEA_SIENNA_45 [Gordonia phage Sienna]QOC56615.1 hypothetical protein SEA_BITESIZE_45 [Gordonia phage BiteSize]QYW00848.1 hypothetical protein SEA_MADI_45 [Gordonia phage Madi]